MIRIGAFGGEVLVNPDSGNDAHGLGYKFSINQNLAAYGMLFLDNDNSYTNITGGASYTAYAAGFILNGNVEIFSQSDTTAGAGSSPSETFIDIRASAYYQLKLNSVKGSIYLGGDVDIEVEPDSNSDIYLAARWIPKRNVVLDLGAYASLDEADVSTVGTPVFVRLNVGF